jgi:hypothetical protein
MYISKKIVICTSIISVLLFVSTTGIGFYYGTQHQLQEIRRLKDEQSTSAASYAKGIGTLQAERNAALNDYQAACYEYQKLRGAYDLLYDATGMQSGQAKYSSPNDARGNEESCYR